MIRRFLLLPLLLLPLMSCEVGLSAGYNLPRTDACRDASSLPGRPIGTDCLDDLGRG